MSCLEIKDCREVNLGLLGAAFPGVTDLKMNYSSLVEGSAGGSGDLFPRLQKVKLLEWKDCRCRSVQCYHQVNGDDLDASKVSNSRCVRADAALSLRPIRHPFAAFFLAKSIL